MTNYSDLSHSLKYRGSWDKTFIFPVPRSRVQRPCYLLNVLGENKEEIQKAIALLAQEHVYCQEIKTPEEHFLSVSQPLSVNNLRRFWTKEFEKSKLAQAIKEQNLKGGK